MPPGTAALNIEPCPGCAARLPAYDGPTHRYIGASPACWAIYTAMISGGEPPLAPGPFNALLVDAYAAQHPGTPSPQAIQSVAVHLLTLHGVLARGVAVERALWLRQQALNERHGSRRGRFQWLTPPSFAGTLTVAAIAAAPDPPARTALAQHYVAEVLAAWEALHGATITALYDRFIGAP